MTATALLVEDEADTRDLLARAIERGGYVCLKAADVDEALARAEEVDTLDVVVTDVVLGRDDDGGLRLLTKLRAKGVRAPVVIITAYADVDKVKRALNGGAAHLLEKPFRAAELLAVLERVREDQGGTAAALEHMMTRARLTVKERTVAAHLLRGLSSSEIAALEENSPKTIRQHVSQIYAKCGVESRAEFFRLAYAR
jgi:DNA-binding NarL/FixJ family response regulator